MTDRDAFTPLSPSFSRVSLALLAHQTEANLLGNVHGGEIMKLADTTAGAVAQRHRSTRGAPGRRKPGDRDHL